MEDFTLDRSLKSVNSVASVLVRQDLFGHKKDFILARSLINANSATRFFAT